METPIPARVKRGGIVWPKCETDENGLNRALRGHIESDAVMEQAGFRRIVGTSTGPQWYLCRGLEPGFTLNVTIYDSGKLRIEVLDESFCQPYDYQRVLSRDAGNGFANAIWTGVEAHMAHLGKLGIVTGHEPGEYI